MTQQELPQNLTLGELNQVAREFGGQVEPLSSIFAKARLPKRDFAEAVLSMADGDALQDAYEKPAGIAQLEEELANVEKRAKEAMAVAIDGGDNELKEVEKIIVERNALQERINQESGLETFVLERATELVGKTSFDYHEDALEWRQQVDATKEYFGGDGSLILWPIDDLEHVFFEQEIGHIAVGVCNGKTINVVTTMEPNGSNSTFFKDVGALVGKPDATNGINSVTVFEDIDACIWVRE